MSSLEHQHRSQADSLVTTSAYVDTQLAHVIQESVALCRSLQIESNKCALTANILNLIYILELCLEVCTDLPYVFEQLFIFNLTDDSSGLHGAYRVAHPGVVQAVRLSRSQAGTSVETSSLELFGKGDHVR